MIKISSVQKRGQELTIISVKIKRGVKLTRVKEEGAGAGDCIV